MKKIIFVIAIIILSIWVISRDDVRKMIGLLGKKREDAKNVIRLLRKKWKYCIFYLITIVFQIILLPYTHAFIFATLIGYFQGIIIVPCTLIPATLLYIFSSKSDRKKRKLINKFLMLIIFLVLLFILIETDLIPSKKGFVTDKYTDNPLNDVNVCYRVSSYSISSMGHYSTKIKEGCVITNSAGYYEIPRSISFKLLVLFFVSPGKMIVDANVEDYNGKSQTIHINGIQVTSSEDLNFELIPSNLDIPDCYIYKNYTSECLSMNAMKFALKTNDIKYCNFSDQLSEKSDCLIHFAKKDNNVSICYLISNASAKGGGWPKRSDCLMHFANKNNNVSICYLISNASAPGGSWSRRDFCFKELGRCELAENPRFRYKVCGIQEI